MCGICGIFNFDATPLKRELLEEMNDTMYLRGPDDSGLYFEKNFGMAMRRLSIIDVNGGHQPISNEDGTIWVILNGEIYNYVELRKELEEKGHQFSTSSDTEVLVHLYEEYGTDSVTKLNGMFAFALWDSIKKRLWVVRDRLGIKPLVYFEHAGGVVFASTLMALKKHPNFKSIIDYESLLLFFSLAYIPTPRTIWQNVKKLLPGHWMLIEKGYIKIHKYWDAEQNINHGMNHSEFVEETKLILKDSIKLHSRSDVPVGTFLSGGVDSGAVTALFCQQSEKPVHTFTMDFEDKVNNEGSFAKIVSEQYKTNHHAQTLTWETANDVLYELLPLMDEPMADSAIIPSYLLAKSARDNDIKVVLCGAGGDEFFGGYGRHYLSKRDQLTGRLPFIVSNIWAKAAKRFNAQLVHYATLTWDSGVSFGTGTSGVQLGYFAQMLRNPKDFQNSLELVKEHFSDIKEKEKSRGFAYSRMLMDVKHYLVDNVLALTDRTCMAASIEARVPLLDHRLAEHVFGNLPSINLGKDFKESKRSLKEAITSYLPPTILKRPKTGFNGPVMEWVSRGSSQMKKRVLKPHHSLLQEMFDQEVVERIWMNSHSRKSASESLFMMYLADLWLGSHA
jgi:asparagine synthase (glutamine-hydrolysing)